MPNLYLPHLQTLPGPVEGQSHPCAPGGLPTGSEWALLELIRTHPDQRRPTLQCDVRLVQAARHKARRFRELQVCDHTVDGVSANRNVVNHGYRLPNYYNPDANNVESYACGPLTPAEALHAWLTSPKGHIKHVLGLLDGYRGQTVFGIGTWPSATGRNDIWVLITAHPEG